MAKDDKPPYKTGDRVRITLKDGTTREGVAYEAVQVKRTNMWAVNVVVTVGPGHTIVYGNRDSWLPNEYVGIKLLPTLMTLD